jgi:hypothetical protein
MATRIYRIGYAFSVFTRENSKNVPSAFGMSSLSLYYAHSLHVAAMPCWTTPDLPSCCSPTVYLQIILLIDYDWVQDLTVPMHLDLN